jgi:hypothetical protein
MNFEEMNESAEAFAKYELMKQERMATYTQGEKEAYRQAQADLIDLSNELGEIQDKYKEVNIDELTDEEFNRYINDRLK